VVQITVFCNVISCNWLLCGNIWGNLLPCSMLALSIFSGSQDMSISVALMVLLTHLQTVWYKQISHITSLGKNMPYGPEIMVPDTVHSITFNAMLRENLKSCKTCDVSRVTVAVPWQCESNRTVSTVWWASSVSVHWQGAVQRCCQMYQLVSLPIWIGSTWCWQKPESWNAMARTAWRPRTNLWQYPTNCLVTYSPPL